MLKTKRASECDMDELEEWLRSEQADIEYAEVRAYPLHAEVSQDEETIDIIEAEMERRDG